MILQSVIYSFHGTAGSQQLQLLPPLQTPPYLLWRQELHGSTANTRAESRLAGFAVQESGFNHGHFQGPRQASPGRDSNRSLLSERS